MTLRHVKVAVIGGGITGRLVQWAIPEAEIFDWRPPGQAQHLTRHFGANYLWQPIANIPCRSFRVVTHVDGHPATLDSVLRYKEKIGKSGDVLDWERQFTLYTTGYEFEELPAATIHWDHHVVTITRQSHTILFKKHDPVTYDYLISTIPLYALLGMVDSWALPLRYELKYKPIFFRVTNRPPDAPQPLDVLYVNYLSNPDIAPYRYCDRFGKRHFESIVPYENGRATMRIPPGKIYAHPGVEEELANLMAADIYTFGRFGSWRPDELVHETWARILQWRDTIYHAYDSGRTRLHG